MGWQSIDLEWHIPPAPSSGHVTGQRYSKHSLNIKLKQLDDIFWLMFYPLLLE